MNRVKVISDKQNKLFSKIQKTASNKMSTPMKVNVIMEKCRLIQNLQNDKLSIRIRRDCSFNLDPQITRRIISTLSQH